MDLRNPCILASLPRRSMIRSMRLPRSLWNSSSNKVGLVLLKLCILSRHIKCTVLSLSAGPTSPSPPAAVLSREDPPAGRRVPVKNGRRVPREGKQQQTGTVCADRTQQRQTATPAAHRQIWQGMCPTLSWMHSRHTQAHSPFLNRSSRGTVSLRASHTW